MAEHRNCRCSHIIRSDKPEKGHYRRVKRVVGLAEAVPSIVGRAIASGMEVRDARVAMPRHAWGLTSKRASALPAVIHQQGLLEKIHFFSVVQIDVEEQTSNAGAYFFKLQLVPIAETLKLVR